MTVDKGKAGAGEIDLEEVARLLDALERDLAQVRGGSPDLQRLRDEAETLKNVLNSPIRRRHWIRDGLHSMRKVFEESVDTAVAESVKGSRYIAEIGRILGM